MGDDNVSPAQNKIWPVLTGWLTDALSAEGSFLLSVGKAQVEVSAKEKGENKRYSRRENSEDPPMPSREAAQQRAKRSKERLSSLE